jgi:uncharacterized protein (DUF433 family)
MSSERKAVMAVQELVNPKSPEFQAHLQKHRERMKTAPPITKNPERMSGTPVIGLSRVPVSTMLDHFAAGHTLDEFLEQFPTVDREKAIAALDIIKEAMDAGALAEEIDY